MYITVSRPSTIEPKVEMKQQQTHEGMFVEYHIRGRSKKSSTRQCCTLAEILVQAEKLFPSFHARNPWISVDSERNEVYVGVDPARQKP